MCIHCDTEMEFEYLQRLEQIEEEEAAAAAVAAEEIKKTEEATEMVGAGAGVAIDLA